MDLLESSSRGKQHVGRGVSDVPTDSEAVLGLVGDECDCTRILTPQTARQTLQPVRGEVGGSPGCRLRSHATNTLGEHLDEPEDMGVHVPICLEDQSQKVILTPDEGLVLADLLAGLVVRVRVRVRVFIEHHSTTRLRKTQTEYS